MKKYISFILLPIMLSALLSGCMKTTDSSEAVDQKKEVSTEASNESSQEDSKTSENSNETEKMDLTFIERRGREWDKNSEVYKMIEDKYNINLNVEYVQEQGSTQSWYSLRIAAGDTPDYLVDVTFSDYNNYAKQGMFSEIPIEWIKQYAPNMVNWYNKEAGDNIWNLYNIDGKNYALPILWSLGNHWSSLAIRQDWLNDVGIETEPTTISELETAMEKVKADKNLDYVISGSNVDSFDFIGGAYDVYFGEFYKGDDGKLYRGEFAPNAKEVVTKLNDWYSKGYIDKEFVTNKDDMVKDRWLNSKTMLIKDCWPDFVSDKAWYGGGTFFSGLKENDANANPVQIPAPKGPNGNSGFIMSNPVVGAFCFSSELPEEKIKKYLEIFDDQSQNFDALELTMKGIEGKHFEINEEGTYIKLPPYDKEDDSLVKDGVGLMIPGCFNNYTAQMPFMTAPSATDERIKYETMNIGKYDILKPTYREVWAEKGTQFNDFCEKSLIDFITGARPISEYDDFVNEAMTDYSGKDIMDEAKETFDKINTK